MNLLDVGVGIIVAFITIRGFFRGFFRELFGCVGWLLGGVCAAIYYAVPAPWIAQRWTLPPAIAEALGGIGVFLAIWGTAKILGWALDRLTEKSLREAIDGLAGMLLGSLKALILCSFVLLVFTLRRGAPEISFRIPDSFCGTWLVERAKEAIEIGRVVLPAPSGAPADGGSGEPSATPSPEPV